ncbi:MAG: class I SAM-dependent methyltransferase [Candidatus Pacebacteria bacterium]|nr:class I SAM-dependent methyltransferase [Candidatus Paceibacterota bacterium]
MIKSVLKVFLRWHNFCYTVISSLAIKYEGGIHPKHRILNYHQFFLDNIKAGDKVLDIGCSSGELAFGLAKKASKVVGIDFNEKHLLKAKNNNKAQNIEYILGDATQYNFQEKFDVAVLSNVLEHIEDRVGFLRKISLIAPKILIRVPLLTRDWLACYKKEIGVEYRLDKTHFIEYTKEQFKEEVEKAGLKIEKEEVNFGEIYAKL